MEKERQMENLISLRRLERTLELSGGNETDLIDVASSKFTDPLLKPICPFDNF